MPDASPATLRERLARIFDDDEPTAAGRFVNRFLAALIVLNVVGIVLESVEPVHATYPRLFDWLEEGATGVFTLEYVARVWSIVDSSNRRFRHPLWGRLRYMRTFFAVVDLVSILPALLGLLGGADFRVVRLVRLMRMLKLTRHSSVFNLLWAVFREEARSLLAVLFVVGIALTMSAATMYLVEGDAQPAVFKSIPACMWWAIETITTVGYGDMVPKTVAGRVVGGLVSIVGIGTLALFTGLITVSFMDQLRVRRTQYRRIVKAQMAGGPLDDAARDHIERIGTRLGLGDQEVEGLVDDTRKQEGTAPACPHCGHLLIGFREPRAPSAGNTATGQAPGGGGEEGGTKPPA